MNSEDVYYTPMAADVVASAWVYEKSGRQAIVVMDRQTHWSTAQVHAGSYGAVGSPSPLRGGLEDRFQIGNSTPTDESTWGDVAA